MLRWVSLLLAVIVWGVPLPVCAYPTLTGPTGFTVLPTSAVTPGIAFALDYQELPEMGSSLPARVTLGLGHSVEVGVLYDAFGDETFLERARGAHAKIALPRMHGADVALGVQVRREQFDKHPWARTREIDYEQAYLVWSNSHFRDSCALSRIDFTWGVNWTRVEPQGCPTFNDIRMFAGMQLQVTERFSLLGEFQTRGEAIGDHRAIASIAARMHFDHGIRGQVGLTNAVGLIGYPDYQFFAGIAFEAQSATQSARH